MMGMRGWEQKPGTQDPSAYRHKMTSLRCAHWGQEVALGSHPGEGPGQLAGLHKDWL